jgi:mono/diheme cytochrome c family protein
MRSLSSTSPALLAAVGAATFLSVAGILSADAVPKAKQWASKSSASKQRTGEQVYKQECAACHGPKGEGTKAHRKTLAGTQSVGQLATFIAKSMPPGPGKKLPKADAQKVAGYIHGAFYSPLAQERNRPARIELSRLTVRQYRNAVADLVGSFRAPVRLDERRGLRAEYFKTGRFRGERVLERVDPQIQFDFGTAGALPEQNDPYTFAMRWEGSVLAPDTGEYEIILKTEHAARLWINDLQRPLIDALVKSGNDNEYRASAYLMGGRAYALRLEFSKGVQGVDNLAKLKEKPPQKASVMLEWRPPHRAPEVISQRSLSPVVGPEVYTVQTPFPPDDRSIGYERGTSISKEWNEATTEAAIETATYVAAKADELAGIRVSNRAATGFSGNPAGIRLDREGQDTPPAERTAKLRAFCRQFVERAFRRPLTDDVAKQYVDRQFEGAPDLETAVKRIVLLTLKSPRFLYREMGSGTPDPYDVAARLSFGLWDSLPDQDLLKAAAAGELVTRDQVAKQAERMAADLRTWAKLREFFLQWLKVDNHPDLAKNPKRYPEFDQAVASDLRTSLELSLEKVVWSERSDFRELLLTDKFVLNGRLAKIYGVNLPPDAPFQEASLEPVERAGILTHPYLLASFAYLDGSSPIHRGVLISRNLLGRALQPPPEAFTPLPANLHPKLTTRQRVAMQTKPAACMSCHSMINPLGFTLERFDAIGRLREKENGLPVDASGSYQSRSGQTVKFNGARDLANFLAGSDEAHTAFVERLFHHLVKQPVRAFGPNTMTDLKRSFRTNGFSIRKQMVEVMALTALKREEGLNGRRQALSKR